MAITLKEWQKKAKKMERKTRLLEKKIGLPFAKKQTKPRTRGKDRLLEKMGLKSRRIISQRAKKIS